MSGDLNMGTNAITASDAALNITTNTVVTGDLTITIGNDSIIKAAKYIQFQVDVNTTTAAAPAAGVLCATSDWILYISTGTSVGQWIKVGGQ